MIADWILALVSGISILVASRAVTLAAVLSLFKSEYLTRSERIESLISGLCCLLFIIAKVDWIAHGYSDIIGFDRDLMWSLFETAVAVSFLRTLSERYEFYFCPEHEDEDQ
jgi:hypothetical protein